MSSELEEEVLRALRRITRAIDIHSRQLATHFGLTGPQLVCLRAIGKKGKTIPSELAHDVSLSAATITGILDRLSARQLITRERSSGDRRLVTVAITPAGRALIDSAPSPLQERFTKALNALPASEQGTIRDTLNTIVRMMGGETIDAAPVLAAPSTTLSPEENAEASEAARTASKSPDR